MKRLVSYFLKGLFVFVPVAITIYAIIFAFTKIDGWMGFPIPGLGLLITAVFITFLGFLASNFLGKRLFELIDQLFSKLPVVKMLYSAIKDLINAFSGDTKKFDKPVVVELVPGGPKALGFITRNDLAFLSLENSVAVYFPQSYNFAGSVLIFPSEQVVALDVESTEVMTFIVSGGVSGK